MSYQQKVVLIFTLKYLLMFVEKKTTPHFFSRKNNVFQNDLHDLHGFIEN